MDQRTATILTAGVIFMSAVITSPFLFIGALILWALMGVAGVVLLLAMIGGIYWVFGSVFRKALVNR